MTRGATLSALGIVIASLLAAPCVLAQQGGSGDEDEAWLGGEKPAEGGEAAVAAEEPAGEPAEGAGAGEAGSEGGEAKPASEDDAWISGKEVKEIEAPEEDKTFQLKEDPKKWYFGLAFRPRYFAVPAGEQKWFGVEKAGTVHAYGLGIEAEFRYKGVSIIPGVWFSQLKKDDLIYREKGDPITSTEMWDVNLKLIVVSIEFLGSYAIKDWLYFTYGAGIGALFRIAPSASGGDLVRNEAYPDADGDWTTCGGPGVPDPTVTHDPAYCEVDGGHYDRNWEGWAVDPFYPFIDILVGLRFKPIPNFFVSLDAGIILPLLPTLDLRVGAIF